MMVDLIEWFVITLWQIIKLPFVIAWEEGGVFGIIILLLLIVIAFILSPLGTSECIYPWEKGYNKSKMKDDIDEINKKMK